MRGLGRGDRGRLQASDGAVRVRRGQAVPAELSIAAAVGAAFRDEWGRVVATLVRVAGDLDLAEECAQDAFAQALQTWPRTGVPERPGAWLTAVARNRALDRLRREAVEARKLRIVGSDPALSARGGDSVPLGTDEFADDRLRLIFTCCHPALPFEARVALTLRTLAGLTTAEIARAFLVSEPTMAKRLVRARQKIRNAGIPYRVPSPDLLPRRTTGVLAVVYLLFNEGYSASAGADLVRVGLCDEAIRLARALVALLPDDPEVAGLLALMLFTSSRRTARLDAQGEIVTLDQQDRGLWDAEAIAEASALLDHALARGRVGAYQLQAAIAACHATAPTADQTDWRAIVELYRQLAILQPSPVVELNLAVAVAMADGPMAGLTHLDALEPQLASYHLLHATRADLLRRLGHDAEAATSYKAALDLVPTDAERRFLTRRLAEL